MLPSGAHHLAFERLALLGERRDGAADARPGVRIVEMLARLQDEFVDVRLLGERPARQLPDFRQSRVEQLEAAVGAEHRHAFLEAVERLALHVDQRIVAALEREPLRLVDEEVGDAAVGAFLGQHLQRAPVRQVPGVVLGAALAVAVEDLALPFASS